PVKASPHNATNCSILVDGDLLYVSTANGVGWRHREVANPKAPSIIVLNRKSGKLVAVDNANIGPDIFHGQWSSPSLGKVKGRKQIFFGGGDGLCYGFEALDPSLSSAGNTLKMIWKFTCDTTARKVEGGPSSYPKAPDSPTVIVAMPVFYKNRVYVAAGGDPWHGKRFGGLYCIDATKTGDITKSGRIWSYMDLGQSISTVSIKDGLVYITSYGGMLHCLDAETGKLLWKHDTGGEIYSSTMLAGGKLYVSTGLRRRGELWIF
ncbi:MAG: PQQ-binding-like beta-propeller repeat protein, partial [bacterium]|nr:PQQ-binding-like beta-propeller repeat protein [bacterium]